jgi:hypothetical protein
MRRKISHGEYGAKISSKNSARSTGSALGRPLVGAGVANIDQELERVRVLASDAAVEQIV